MADEGRFKASIPRADITNVVKLDRKYMSCCAGFVAAEIAIGHT